MSGPGNLTTSGVTQYSQAATQLITAAFLHMRVINEDETPTEGQFAAGMRALNALVKHWETSGIHIWTEHEGVLFLQANQVRYLLGNGSTDHCADAYSYISQSLSASVAAGATVMPLASAAGIIAKDEIGIVLDSGSAFWSTVSVAPSGNNVTLATPIPSSATSGNLVFDYTTDIVRPLRIPACRRIQFSTTPANVIETPMGRNPGQMLSRQEYMDLPNKTAPGTVTQAYYNPARIQGEFFVWPSPINAANGVRFTWYRPIESFESVDDEPDLPDEWTRTLGWNLADELKLDFAVSAPRAAEIVRMAATTLEACQGWDREAQRIYFGRGYSPSGRSR